MADKYSELSARVRGLGMIWGLELEAGLASEASREAFDRGLLLETAGARDQVLKFLPPLVIEDDQLYEGLAIVDQALAALVENRQRMIAGGV
jgi:diaminobutyrate-2-oxoglutarate transaminase